MLTGKLEQHSSHNLHCWQLEYDNGSSQQLQVNIRLQTAKSDNEQMERNEHATDFTCCEDPGLLPPSAANNHWNAHIGNVA